MTIPEKEASESYPAQGVIPLNPTMSACEVLCWIGYRRAIKKRNYFEPLFDLERSFPSKSTIPVTDDKRYARLHAAIPFPKPERCPMRRAETHLIEALRAGLLRAVNCLGGGEKHILETHAFDYAVVVTARNSLEADITASAEDYELARTEVKGEVRFFTNEVLRVWPCQSNCESYSENTPVAQAAETQPAQARVKLRKATGLDYSRDDQPILERMREGICAGIYRNPTDAARALAKDAKGSTKKSSVVTRLITRYGKVFRTERD